jgi:hypothetical protein
MHNDYKKLKPPIMHNLYKNYTKIKANCPHTHHEGMWKVGVWGRDIGACFLSQGTRWR